MSRCHNITSSYEIDISIFVLMRNAFLSKYKSIAVLEKLFWSKSSEKIK
jgi:hypothetical protein